MEFQANLNNIRISPRKMRTVTNLVKGMGAGQAKAQLSSLTKKNAGLVLKLLNSACANARHNFSQEIKEDNLYISQILVEAGPSLKRWLPRAMGRATPILKRTCSVRLVLAEREKTLFAKTVKASQPEIVKPEEVSAPAAEPRVEKIKEQEEAKPKGVLPLKPYGAAEKSKKRFFSRQTFGNIRKIFRRKSI